MKYEDIYRERRREMIRLLVHKGIKDQNVLDVMLKLPRDLFTNPAFINKSYDDAALPIDCKQTISQPYTVAYMTEKLDIRPNMKVLEIGTGSGYQAAILSGLGANVYTIERHNDLAQKAMKLFEKLDLKIKVKVGDGTLGWSQEAPYDRIIVTAGAPDIPISLIKQLKIGGKLIVPIGDEASQVMNLITKKDNDNIDVQELEVFRFVPLIGEEGWN